MSDKRADVCVNTTHVPRTLSLAGWTEAACSLGVMQILAEGVAPLAGECGKCLSGCPVCPPPFARRWPDLAPMKLPRVGPASARSRRIQSVMPDIHDFPGTPSPDRPCEGTAASKHQHRRAMLRALANSHRASLSTFRLRTEKSGRCQPATSRFLPILSLGRPTIDTNRTTAP